MNKIKSCVLAVMACVFVIIPSLVSGQVYSNKQIQKKSEPGQDSILVPEYKYVLPILGKNAVKKGFDLPYSAGVSLNYFWQVSDLIIDNLQVGFNNGTLYNIDDLVRFDNAQATAQALTIRPDFWLFPFLNVYGIFGRSAASTEVGFGLWIPDSTDTPKEIFSTTSKVEFKSTTFGFGVTPTVGVMGGWIAMDMNFSWTDVPQLDKPAFLFVFGPRIGKTFRFKNSDMNLAVWAGGFRVHLSSGTTGSVNLSDVMPVDEWQTDVENGLVRIDDAQQQVDAWWGELSPAEQLKPSNIARYESANALLAKAGEVMTAAGEAISTIGTSTVQYSMDKRPEDMWNFIIGSQYQINKHFMIRAEAGFLSSRTQVNAGIQYRFGL